MVSSTYGQIAVLEASAAFFTYIVAFSECGFWPSRLLGIYAFFYFIYYIRFAKCKTRRIVPEVKNSFTIVFSVLQNLEKPTWFSKKKKNFFLAGFFHFL
jgi:hypothetical protein